MIRNADNIKKNMQYIQKTKWNIPRSKNIGNPLRQNKQNVGSKC